MTEKADFTKAVMDHQHQASAGEGDCVTVTPASASTPAGTDQPTLSPKIRRTYARDFLIKVAGSSACGRMPRGLAEVLKELPLLRRGSGAMGGGGQPERGPRPQQGHDAPAPPNYPRYHNHHHHQPWPVAEQSPTITNAALVRYFWAPRQMSVLDSLPLRPTAQIFTWDPSVQQWVPRSRPQESF